MGGGLGGVGGKGVGPRFDYNFLYSVVKFLNSVWGRGEP